MQVISLWASVVVIFIFIKKYNFPIPVCYARLVCSQLVDVPGGTWRQDDRGSATWFSECYPVAVTKICLGTRLCDDFQRKTTPFQLFFADFSQTDPYCNFLKNFGPKPTILVGTYPFTQPVIYPLTHWHNLFWPVFCNCLKNFGPKPTIMVGTYPFTQPVIYPLTHWHDLFWAVFCSFRNLTPCHLNMEKVIGYIYW